MFVTECVIIRTRLNKVHPQKVHPLKHSRLCYFILNTIDITHKSVNLNLITKQSIQLPNSFYYYISSLENKGYEKLIYATIMQEEKEIYCQYKK